MRIFFPAMLILALAGCASSGPVIDDARLAGLQKGKTTADDIVKDFGRPSFNSDNLDGTRTTAYLQPGTRSDASAMVALIGAIAGGTAANANAIIFRFDEKGRLSGYERTSESPAAVTARSETSVAPASGSAATAPAAASPQPATVRPAPPPRPARADNLPDWLPSSESRDLRNLNN